MSEILREYQILLEHHRRDPDDEETRAQFADARGRMVIAWLEQAMGEA